MLILKDIWPDVMLSQKPGEPQTQMAIGSLPVGARLAEIVEMAKEKELLGLQRTGEGLLMETFFAPKRDQVSVVKDHLYQSSLLTTGYLLVVVYLMVHQTLGTTPLVTQMNKYGTKPGICRWLK
jgi:hypothetical protein